jgi:hypothetical protein
LNLSLVVVRLYWNLSLRIVVSSLLLLSLFSFPEFQILPKVSGRLAESTNCTFYSENAKDFFLGRALMKIFGIIWKFA